MTVGYPYKPRQFYFASRKHQAPAWRVSAINDYIRIAVFGGGKFRLNAVYDGSDHRNKEN